MGWITLRKTHLGTGNLEYCIEKDGDIKLLKIRRIDYETGWVSMEKEYGFGELSMIREIKEHMKKHMKKGV